MPQLPTIASTANRRVLPSADLKVDGATPAAFGAAIGAGIQQLGDAGAQAAGAIQQFQLIKQEEDNRLAEFDRQTTFVSFGSDQATKLEEAQRDLSGPAQDFTKGFLGGFDADAAAFLEKVPERDRHAWQARMGQLRAGVAGNALRAEFTQRDSYYKTTIGDTLGKLANGAMTNPDQLGGFRAQGEQIIAASGLSAQDKLEYTMRWKGSVAVAAAQGDVMRDPEGALARLGGVDHTTALEATGKVAASGAAGKIASVLHGAGLPRNVVAGFLGNLEHESGFKAAGPSGDGGTAHGVAQWRGERADTFRRIIGVDVKSASLEQQAKFITWEMENPKAAGMTVAQRDAILNAKSPEDAARLIDRHYERSDGKNREARATAARKYAGAPAAPGEAARSGEPPAVDPRYADLPADVRAQLSGAAQREIDRKQAVVAQAENAAHNSWLNGFMNDLNDGKSGQADIDAARKSGVLTDYDEINRAETIVEQRNNQAGDLSTFNTLLATPGFTWNPFDDRQTKAVEAAVKNMGGTPQAAFDVWQKTGILAESGSVALRGSMISTSPQQVAAGAAIASNMLARNPNAFAGVKGGDDIEKNALLYGHLVNDLGATPADAAAKVAQQNTPEMKRKIEMGKPETQAFRAQLLKTDVGNKLSNAFGGWFSIDPEFASPEQRNVAAQDYADIASDHFAQYGDSGAADAYALAQMKKLYGAVNGRIMKYPPTRAYPAVGGSQQYIFDQAAADITQVTGRTIDPSKVYLMPVPTATAEAFRAGKPAPYAVHYLDEVNGQQVYRVLNGKAFFADPGIEARRVGRQRQADLAAARLKRQQDEQFTRDARTARFGRLPGDK